MTRAAAALLGALALAGCASSPSLPYTPARQPAGVAVSADVRAEGDRLRVEIDTGGYRLEDAQILRGDGNAVRPQTIEHPGFRGPGSGVGLGLGVGGGGRSGVGVGVGVGTALGSGGRSEGGHTFVFFPLAEVGPAPWRLSVKVVGIDPVVIVLDPSKPRS